MLKKSKLNKQAQKLESEIKKTESALERTETLKKNYEQKLKQEKNFLNSEDQKKKIRKRRSRLVFVIGSEVAKELNKKGILNIDEIAETDEKQNRNKKETENQVLILLNTFLRKD